MIKAEMAFDKLPQEADTLVLQFCPHLQSQNDSINRSLPEKRVIIPRVPMHLFKFFLSALLVILFFSLSLLSVFVSLTHTLSLFILLFYFL